VSANRHLKISIAGQEPKGKQHRKHQGRCIGAYTTEDLAAKKRRLEQIIADHDPQEFPCQYNPSTGQMYCDWNCVSLFTNEICAETACYDAERELLRLNMRPFLTLAFSDPGIAAMNDLFNGECIINGNL
jgi:hypothetical protein